MAFDAISMTFDEIYETFVVMSFMSSFLSSRGFQILCEQDLTLTTLLCFHLTNHIYSILQSGSNIPLSSTPPPPPPPPTNTGFGIKFRCLRWFCNDSVFQGLGKSTRCGAALRTNSAFGGTSLRQINLFWIQLAWDILFPSMNSHRNITP